jgi:hypothetical protein
MQFITNHWAWALASFFFGGMFAPDLRRFLTALVFGGRHRLMRFRRDNTAAKLRKLERVHGNVYELLRYLGEQGVWIGLTALLFLGQTYMANVPESAWFLPHLHQVVHTVGSKTTTPPDSTAPQQDLLSEIMVGGMYCYLALSIGRLTAMFAFLRSLRDFPIVRARLASQIQEIDGHLMDQIERDGEAPIPSAI